MEQPRAGAHYPRSMGELQAWFRTDGDCLDYLEWLRWPRGFVCPSCGHIGGWRLGDGRFKCPECDARPSATAGTIFDRTRAPLTVWFAACWLFATGKNGISALSLKRIVAIGSYQTAWAILHRLRSVLVRPGRDRLSGSVEVDETYIGGPEPWLAGGRAHGKKVLVGIAVEIRDPRGIGRCRMRPLADLSSASLHSFVTDHVESGTRVVTDGWDGYRGLDKLGYVHERRSQRAALARGEDGRLLPLRCIVLPRWPRDGCWEPTRARRIAPTLLPTSISSCFGSIAEARAAAGCCFIVSLSSPLPTPRCATGSSSLPGIRAQCPRYRRRLEGTPRALTAP